VIAVAGIAVLLATAAMAQSPAPKQERAAAAADAKKAKKIFEQGRNAERAGDWKSAYELHTEATALAPANTNYVVAREAARFRLVQQRMDRAEREALAGRMEEARAELREALRLDPTYTVAQERLQQFAPRLRAAATEALVLPVEGLIRVEPQPGKRTFNYRGTVQGAWENLGQQFGLTISLEDEVRRRAVEFNVKDVDFWAAAALLAKLTATQWRALDRRAILVYEDTAQKRRLLEPSVVRTVALTGSTTTERMTETMRLVREIAGVARTQLDTRSGTLTLRDSPETIELAMELISQLEQKRGEVMLEIDILEVDRATSRRLGISPPVTGRVVTISPQDIEEARASAEGLLRVIQRLFGALPASGISGQVRPESLIPPLIAFGGGRTVFLATLPGAAAEFSESLSLVRQGRRVLLRGEDGQQATFFVGERFPINLAVLSPGVVSTPIAPGVTTQSFERVDVDTGEEPVSVVAADFDGDGDLDLAVANQASNTLSILLGNGDGTFQDALELAAGVGPAALVTGDFNNDGRPDLAVANQADNSISIYVSNGDGTFGAPIDTAAGFGPRGLVAADFDTNGRVDLAVANGDADTVSILLGNGDGTFVTATVLVSGAGPRGLATADLNGDNAADLVATNESAGTVSVWLGTGGGAFGVRTDFLTGAQPSGVAIADLDGDGLRDLIVANRGSDNLSVFEGNGDGTFTARTDFATGAGPASVVARDVSGDGEIDVVTANENADTITVLAGDGAGGFSVRGDFAVGDAPVEVTTGDFDGDGKIDVVAANRGADSVTLILNRLTLVPSGQQAIAPYPGFQYEDLGVKVRATPRLHADGEVTLQLQIELRQRGADSFNGIPVINNRAIEQTVRLKENETTVLAGIIQGEQTRGTTGWPLLGRLPVAGHLTSVKTRNNRESELIILMTPRRIHLPERKSKLLYAGREATAGAGGTLGAPVTPQQPPP
jgi:Flp pilus assembly secretin CpaC